MNPLSRVTLTFQQKEVPMTKHLADHRTPSDGSRVKNFARIESKRDETVWNLARQQPRDRSAENKRLAEFTRIERGIEA